MKQPKHAYIQYFNGILVFEALLFLVCCIVKELFVTILSKLIEEIGEATDVTSF